VFHPAVEDATDEEQSKEGTHTEEEESSPSEDALASQGQPNASFVPCVRRAMANQKKTRR
jgi:hypothetical protein